MKCKYYDSCEQARSSAKTCMEDGGGSYCGQFRVMTTLASSDQQLSFPARPDVPVKAILA